MLNYFAYGSNLSIRRLRARVPSVDMLCVASLEEHRLALHKRNKDGSAKADCFFTGDGRDLLWGCVFAIAENEKPLLDKVEGLGQGYEEKLVQVSTCTGELVEAYTYYATDIYRAGIYRADIHRTGSYRTGSYRTESYHAESYPTESHLTESCSAESYSAGGDVAEDCLASGDPVVLVENTLPYSWYMQHIIRGAEELGLADEYLAFLRAVPTQEDPVQARMLQELSIY